MKINRLLDQIVVITDHPINRIYELLPQNLVK